MRTIYKYEIIPDDLGILMPNASTILSVGAQGDELVLWAEIDTEEKEEWRRFQVFGTGHRMPKQSETLLKYLGTAFMGELVWHIYEDFTERPEAFHFY